MLGFSAGGHLTAATATNFDKRAYEAIDDVDKVSCRPDFAVLVYPAYLAAKDKAELMPDIRVSAETPPCSSLTPATTACPPRTACKCTLL